MMTEDDLMQIQAWVKSEWLIAPSHVNTMIAEIRRLQNEILCEKEMVKKTGAQVDTLLKLVDMKDKHLQEFEKDARRYRCFVRKVHYEPNEGRLVWYLLRRFQGTKQEMLSAHLDEAMQAEGEQT